MMLKKKWILWVKLMTLFCYRFNPSTRCGYCGKCKYLQNYYGEYRGHTTQECERQQNSLPFCCRNGPIRVQFSTSITLHWTHLTHNRWELHSFFLPLNCNLYLKVPFLAFKLMMKSGLKFLFNSLHVERRSFLLPTL